MRRPAPKAGEVLVRVHAAGVNASDQWIRAFTPNVWALRLLRGAAIAGLELAGVVAERGPGARHFEVGQPVFGALPGTWDGGSYAEYVAMSEDWLGKKPQRMSFVEAAGAPVGGMTALAMVREKARVRAGERVLVHGASGAVGAVAVQLAKLEGARVVGVASGRNLEYVRSLGADETIDYMKTDVARAGTFDVVLDVVGGLPLDTVLALTEPGARYFSTTPTPATFWKARKLARARRNAGVMMVRPSRASLTELAALIDAGEVRLPVDRVLPLADAGLAQQYLRTGHPAGRVILEVGGAGACSG